MTRSLSVLLAATTAAPLFAQFHPTPHAAPVMPSVTQSIPSPVVTGQPVVVGQPFVLPGQPVPIGQPVTYPGQPIPIGQPTIAIQQVPTYPTTGPSMTSPYSPAVSQPYTPPPR